MLIFHNFFLESQILILRNLTESRVAISALWIPIPKQITVGVAWSSVVCTGVAVKILWLMSDA